MFEIMRHVHDALMDWLEPAGIIAGLVFSGLAFRNEARGRQIENRIKLVEGYREIWSLVMHDPSLERIRSRDVDLLTAPISPAEDRLVRFIFQNLMLAFEARAVGQLGDIGVFERDVAEFVTRPIPRAVWQEIARFQPDGFRRFVDRLIPSE